MFLWLMAGHIKRTAPKLHSRWITKTENSHLIYSRSFHHIIVMIPFNNVEN